MRRRYNTMRGIVEFMESLDSGYGSPDPDGALAFGDIAGQSPYAYSAGQAVGNAIIAPVQYAQGLASGVAKTVMIAVGAGIIIVSLLNGGEGRR